MIIYFETLGCSRNQVDSEVMLGKLLAAGHTRTHDPAKARVIVVNTCGFIASAADEAVDTILEMAQYKKQGACRRLIVTGCLAQRYKDDPGLTDSLPEVDAFLGTGACEQIVDVVDDRAVSCLTLFPDPNARSFADLSVDRALSGDPYAFVKVSEGCNRHCTYCIIPTLRGRQRSRPLDDICTDALSLVTQGVKEIILTAENTTDYGRDLKDGTGFADVLETLSRQTAAVDPDVWIRMLYTHPESLTRQIVDTVKAHDNICAYYDVPIQHADTTMLRRMGRPYSRTQLKDLFAMIRQTDPDAALRTTVITGFPGETQEMFDSLLHFIQEICFDHLGVFTYSDAEDLPSHALTDHVSEDVAQVRHDTLMAAQAEISGQINQKHVGKTYPVLVEENPEPGLFTGRTMFQAPEVDGVTFIYSDGLAIGSRVQVKITDGYEYDIAGEKA
ncbi:30S ribosomal protein S12 methylthiotransferase RimO [Desulfotignum balticum]|uniref:30S ribosomal protein S12 methylthiotransferase RimO n=1 Tax=Desulfotignum balticum TaxID=115781 RepID=UPI000426BBDA|nr:30S ribosomal protein S12 methylthiotransferase RimO [Desulfotignum balticum]